MAIWYVRPDVGSASNGGTGWGDAKQRVSQLTSVFIGDEVRVSKSPDPTSMGQAASWTNKSRSITLSTAVTENIDTGDNTLGTPSTSVSASISASSSRKQGTGMIALVVDAAFTTGLAYHSTGDLGSGKDLSPYQQISFWLYCNRTIESGALSIKLYSNNDGTGEVASFDLPYNNRRNTLVPYTIDLGSAMHPSVKSWGLYINTAFGSTTSIWVDNMIACKSPADPDSLNLMSLVGKGLPPRWNPSTAYAVDDIISPTASSMKSMIFKCISAGGSGLVEPNWPDFIGDTVDDSTVTWENIGFEESWYTIKSIDGIDIELNSWQNINNGQGYYGETESATIYKRETIKLDRAISDDETIDLVLPSKSFSAAHPITVTGGWDVNTDSIDGETFLDGGSNMGYAFSFSNNRFIEISNITNVRFNLGFGESWDERCSGILMKKCQAISDITGFFNFAHDTEATASMGSHRHSHCKAVMNINGWGGHFPNGLFKSCYAHSNEGVGFSSTQEGVEIRMGHSKYNSTYGYDGQTSYRVKLNRLETADNGTSSIRFSYNVNALNCKFEEPNELTVYQSWYNTMIFSKNHDGVEGNDVILMDNGQAILQGSIIPSGYSKAWRISPTSTDRGSRYPIRFPIGKIAVAENELVTVSVLLRRSNTGLSARLILPDGLIRGVPHAVYSDLSAAQDVWETVQISFTPAQKGVVPLYVYVWGGSTYHCYLTGVNFNQG